MDLSPRLLTDIQFREQWRGYNPEEVDDFLERVATGVEQLQQRLNDALERASNAERRLLERNDDDEIRRTLVLAQRTADASLEEARIEAERVVAEATAQAARLDAEIATRRRVELGELAEQRAALQLDIDSLRAYVEGEQARMAEVLSGQIEWLTTGYALAEVPAVSDVTAPPDPDEPAAPAPVVETVTTAEPVSEVDELRRAREGLSDALRRAGVAGDDAPSVAASEASEERPDEPAWRGTAEDDDDPFLAELRRAVGDTEPLGPRDHRVEPLTTDVEADDEASSGFLRRRRKG